MSGITNPAERYFKDGLWTFDGTVWRPQSQMFGVRTRYAEVKSTGAATVGLNTFNTTAVPAGIIQVVTAATWVNWSHACGPVIFSLIAGAVQPMLNMQPTVAAGVTGAFVGWIVMTAGDLLRVEMYNCTLNDGIACSFAGFQFKSAE